MGLGSYILLCTVLVLSCHDRDAFADTSLKELLLQAMIKQLSSDRYDFSESEKTEIVDLHNRLRRTPAARNDAERNDPDAITASDMEQMTWSSDLARFAKTWAERCNLEHGQPRGAPRRLGQNLWSSKLTRLGTDATMDWYNEVSRYTYRAGTGGSCRGVCGHYTQVVWSTTNKVGCGRHFCPRLTTPRGSTMTDAWYIVCNYSPAGNIYGKQPYAL